MGQAEDAGLLQGPFVLFAFSSKWGEISLLQVPLEQVASSAKDAATRHSRMDGLRQTFTLRLIRVKVSPMLVSSRIGWGSVDGSPTNALGRLSGSGRVGSWRAKSEEKQIKNTRSYSSKKQNTS